MVKNRLEEWAAGKSLPQVYEKQNEESGFV